MARAIQLRELMTGQLLHHIQRRVGERVKSRKNDPVERTTCLKNLEFVFSFIW